jgi:hypothetical protein
MDVSISDKRCSVLTSVYLREIDFSNEASPSKVAPEESLGNSALMRQSWMARDRG